VSIEEARALPARAFSFRGDDWAVVLRYMTAREEEAAAAPKLKPALKLKKSA